jgi:hypothetical protein
MKRVHLICGIAAVFVFLLTGQYMAIYQGHLQGMADLPRMLFRSRHIYILFTGLLNLTPWGLPHSTAHRPGAVTILPNRTSIAR